MIGDTVLACCLRPPQIPGKARARYRFIVFCTQSSRCSEIGNFLADRWRGQGFLLTENSNTTDAARTVSEFRASRLGVLLADHSAEERMNLQFADGGLLLDLPFDPMRLEQRLGRMDRMGGGGSSSAALFSRFRIQLSLLMLPGTRFYSFMPPCSSIRRSSLVAPRLGSGKITISRLAGSPVLAPSIQHHPSTPEAVDCSPAGRGTMQGACRGRAERTGAQIERCDRYTTAQQYSAYPNVIAITPRLSVRHPLRHSVVFWIFG